MWHACGIREMHKRFSSGNLGVDGRIIKMGCKEIG
jgi:hypothetical protein